MTEGTTPALDSGAADGPPSPVIEEQGLPVPMNGSTVHPEVMQPKRKIFVKRRSSSFALIQAEAKALRSGEPLVMRRRPVRAKADPMHGTQTP